ncbi:phage minor head protein [Limimaricola variabilis]|uniref:phage head morphogenesis protein n=1 Tax=Limimaricola variabilis TaxID=1492771 RepID=UPI002AC8AAF5|nr:phage minor head protein [Limimaricola variabilis]WPY94685.1 phage minor head protein [Limimaricola variabilis]
MAEPVRATFRRPFAEQLTALRLRLAELVPTARWDDLKREQQERAFMVAGAVKADLLADLAAAVERAVAEGTGFEAFKADWRAAVETHGWHGWTGEGSEKGEAWRMRVVYRTNMQTSYMSGRHAQLVDGDYPFWIYKHSGAEHPRLNHLAWDGLTLPADHAFWGAHYPPNGWGCGCLVEGARSRRLARLLGGDPDKPLPADWQSIDPRTGAPRGIGKGWDYAPGASVADLVLALTPKLDRLPERTSRDLLQDWIRSSVFEGWLAAPKGSWPVLRLPDGAGTGTAVVTPQTVERLGATGVGVADFAMMQRVAATATHRLSLEDGTALFVLVERGQVLVLRIGRDGGARVIEAFRRLSIEAARRDPEIGDLPW